MANPVQSTGETPELQWVRTGSKNVNGKSRNYYACFFQNSIHLTKLESFTVEDFYENSIQSTS